MWAVGCGLLCTAVEYQGVLQAGRLNCGWRWILVVLRLLVVVTDHGIVDVILEMGVGVVSKGKQKDTVILNTSV